MNHNRNFLLGIDVHALKNQWVQMHAAELGLPIDRCRAAIFAAIDSGADPDTVDVALSLPVGSYRAAAARLVVKAKFWAEN